MCVPATPTANKNPPHPRYNYASRTYACTFASACNQGYIHIQGVCNAVVFWFEMVLDEEGTTLSTAPELLPELHCAAQQQQKQKQQKKKKKEEEEEQQQHGPISALVASSSPLSPLPPPSLSSPSASSSSSARHPSSWNQVKISKPKKQGRKVCMWCVCVCAMQGARCNMVDIG
jgi:hypothetical protein